MKALLITSFILKEIFSLIKIYISSKSENRDLPENVKDVYNEEEYNKWKSYNKECKQINMISAISSMILLVLFLVFDWYAKIYYKYDINDYIRYLYTIIVISVLTDLVALPFEYYSTFVIEEKYGMNKSTRLTFFLDEVKDSITDILFSYVTLLIIKFLYEKFGNKGGILIIISIVGIALLLACFVMLFLRLYNKFTPLPDGELKDKLLALCNKYGIKVKKIVIKDASKRTTRANAFCTGLGNRKTISLDDNLVNNYSSDQIVAVFAHEFAHAKYRHMFKIIPLACIKTICVLIVGIILFNVSWVYTIFGFNELNYLIAFMVIDMMMWPIGILYKVFMNYISRKHEYEADTFAAKENYGKELISALKKLSKESLSNINPHPFIVKLDYSHPTLSERIEAIEKNMEV